MLSSAELLNVSRFQAPPVAAAASPLCFKLCLYVVLIRPDLHWMHKVKKDAAQHLLAAPSWLGGIK